MQKILAKREKIILCITIGVVIFSIVFNFLIAPVIKKAETLNKEINIIRIKLKKYMRLLAHKDYIQEKYNKFTSGLNLSSASKDTTVSSLSVLEALAKDANIRIIDLRPQTIKNLDLYKEIIIDLRAEGTIEGYLKFIYNIDNSLSLLRIKKFQLNAKPNTQALESNFSISQLSLTE